MRSTLTLSLAYIGCFVASALYLQTHTPLPAGVPGASIEFSTAALLWILSLVFLRIAGQYLRTRAMLLWLAGSAILAALAIDELYELHEKTSQVVGNDDPFKLVAWIGSGCLLYWIGRWHTQSPDARTALFGGFLLQTAWMVVELGDGDLFRIPFLSRRQLRAGEEFLELFFLATLLLGFLLIEAEKVRPMVGQLSRQPGKPGEMDESRDHVQG